MAYIHAEEHYFREEYRLFKWATPSGPVYKANLSLLLNGSW
jgi:hypothetical protein